MASRVTKSITNQVPAVRGHRKYQDPVSGWGPSISPTEGTGITFSSAKEGPTFPCQHSPPHMPFSQPLQHSDIPFLPHCSHLLSLKHVTKCTHAPLLTRPHPLCFLPHDSRSSQCALSSRSRPCGSAGSALPCLPSSAWSNAFWVWVWVWVCPPDFATSSEPAGIPGVLHQEWENVPPCPKPHLVNGPSEQGCLGPTAALPTVFLLLHSPLKASRP